MPKDHAEYESAFSCRYGSAEMRAIWSEYYKRLAWREMWFILATAQHDSGQVTSEELNDIARNWVRVDVDASLTEERETKHDLVAELRVFASQCEVGGSKLHLGATSSDIVDNAEIIRIKSSRLVLSGKLLLLLEAFADKVERYADLSCMGWTHLQAAEPTTVGYRMAGYLQDLLGVYRELLAVEIKPKGFRGAVGTGASFSEEVRGKEHPYFLSEPHLIVTQVYPRIQDYRLVSVLAQLAAVLHRFAFDMRLLQSNGMGEWFESFGKGQVGSSAMPFKRNPINSENICSLARLVAALPRVMWDNAANSFLERTLDDSANKRVVLPQAFLACDEMVERTGRIVEGMIVDENKVFANLREYGSFSATEKLLLALVEAGADRQEMHGVIAAHCCTAVECGKGHRLDEALTDEPAFHVWMSEQEIWGLITDSVDGWVGDAPDRARKLVKEVRELLPEPDVCEHGFSRSCPEGCC